MFLPVMFPCDKSFNPLWSSRITKIYRNWKLGLTVIAIVVGNLACLKSTLAEEKSEANVLVQADSVEVLDNAVPKQSKLVQLQAQADLTFHGIFFLQGDRAYL